ncbi:MAG: zf-HC2 domain-containing protein, partial [Terracidiphilus sp.]
MTATSQHGLHPDAESLSAFSEQALGKRERAEVLAHLSVCGRCRQVVTLAREAADAGTETAAPTHKTVAPNAWWKHWRLVWVPAGVAVAFAVTTISFVIQRADRHGPDIKIAEQNPASGATPPSASSPIERAKVEPPAAATPAPPTAHIAKRAHTAAAEPPPASVPPAVASQMPPEPEASAPEPMDQVEVTPEAHRTFRTEAQQAPPEYATGAMRPAYSRQDTGAREANQEQAEQEGQTEEQRQAGEETS